LKIAAIYVRVSTSDKGQDTAMQVSSCLDLCKNRNWEYQIFEDKMSGRNSNRPEYRRMLELIGAGAVHAVVAYKLDRIARSTQELINIGKFLEEKDCDLVITTQSEIDTSRALGRLLFRLLAVLAEFESDLISERTRDGIAEKKKSGAVFGGDRKSAKYLSKKIEPYLGRWSLRVIREQLRQKRDLFYAALELIESQRGELITDDTDERYSANCPNFSLKRVDESGLFLNTDDPKRLLYLENVASIELDKAAKFFVHLESTGQLENFIRFAISKVPDRHAEIDIDFDKLFS